jgi:hypothetical protein
MEGRRVTWRYPIIAKAQAFYRRPGRLVLARAIMGDCPLAQSRPSTTHAAYMWVIKAPAALAP